MDEEIVAGGVEEPPMHWTAAAPVPLIVGEATLFIEPTGQLETVPDGEIHTVAPSPDEVFRNTIGAIKECVRSVGEGIEQLGSTLKPQELTVEFSITFDAKGKASVIPILVTSEAGVQTGLKVTAKWEPGKKDKAETSES